MCTLAQTLSSQNIDAAIARYTSPAGGLSARGLVTLHGVRWLLAQSSFPFKCYTVGLGAQDDAGFDVVASNESGARLIGEAADVSPTAFRSHQHTLLKKLWRDEADAEFRILIVNYAAVAQAPPEALPANQWLIAVDVHDGTATAMRG